MKTIRVLAAVLALGCSSAKAEAILDLSGPRQGPARSVLDLSGGTEAPWGEIEIETRRSTIATRGTDAPASGGAGNVGAKAATGGTKTQQGTASAKDGSPTGSTARAELR